MTGLKWRCMTLALKKFHGGVSATIGGIGLWFRFTSYPKWIANLLIMTTTIWVLFGLLTYYNTQGIDRFSPLKENFPSVLAVKCNESGTMLALLRSKRFTTGEEYSACLEVWSLKSNMQLDKLLFKEGEQEGVVFVHPDLMWLGDDLLYIVLPGKESFEQILDRWQKLRREDPFLGDPRFGADNTEQFELRLWNNRLKRSRTLMKGICGINGIERRVFLPLHREKSFVLIDPENEWSIVRLSYTDPKIVTDLYNKQRIVQICELNGGWLRILKTLTIDTIDPMDCIIGITPNNDKLIFLCTHFPTPLNLQMLRLKLWRFKVASLDIGAIHRFDIELPVHGTCDAMLFNNYLRIIHSDIELFNVKYFDLKGKLVDQDVIPTIKIAKLVGESGALPESLSPDGKYLIVQGGRKVWSIRVSDWKVNLLAEGVWIDDIVQWLDKGYIILVIWHKPTFTKPGTISPEPPKYWGFLKFK